MRIIIVVVLCLLFHAQAKTAVNKPSNSQIIKCDDLLAFSNCELIFKWNFLYLDVIKGIAKQIEKDLSQYPFALKKLPDIYVMISSYLVCEKGLSEALENIQKLLGVKNKKCKHIKGFVSVTV
ncbi:hypothetical protein AWZ03_006971 [Drosophila navojoa]|uniref:Uncharacterized protein n=1 Tax=Drosophila navojoa TaxID=7232 RepID=A0A484BD69_DRONA|nr:uncharacterized protein LOC108660061 [Drosophila navojoa]TDG46659.1 hypothetical protein AWZ03_006971 [Drosophila navojoa]